MCYDCRRNDVEDRNKDWADVNRFSYYNKGKQKESILDHRLEPCALPQENSAEPCEKEQKHSARVNAVCIYVPPKGLRYSLATILTASADCTVCIWTLSGEFIRKLEYQHEKPITTVQVLLDPHSKNELSVITGSEDKKVIIWDYHTGCVKMILEGVGSVSGTKPLLRFDKIILVDYIYRKISKSEGRRIDLVVVDQHAGYIFDYETRSIKTSDGNDRVFESKISQFTCAALCHWIGEGGKVDATVTVDINGRIDAWDLSSAKLLHTLETSKARPCHTKKITAMAVLCDSKSAQSDIRVVTGGEDCQIFVWSLDSKGPLNRLMFGHKGPITGITFYDNRQNNPKDIKMLTVGEEGALLVWDFYRAFRKDEGSRDSFKLPLFSPKFHELQNPLTCLSIYVSPADQSVVIITADDLGSAQKWEKSKEAKLAVAEEPKRHSYLDYEVQPLRKRHSGAVTTFVYCIIDDTLITGGDDKTVVQWSLKDHRVKYNLECAHHSPIVGIAIIGRHESRYSILAIDSRGDAAVWNSDDERKKNSFKICKGGKYHEKKSKISGLFHHSSKDRESTRDFIFTVSNDRSCLIWELVCEPVTSTNSIDRSAYTDRFIHKLEYSSPQISVIVQSFENKILVLTTDKSLDITLWPLSFSSDCKVCKEGAVCKVKFPTVDPAHQTEFYRTDDSAHQIEDTDKVVQLVSFSYTAKNPKRVAVAVAACFDKSVIIWSLVPSSSLSLEWKFGIIRKIDISCANLFSGIVVYQEKTDAALDATYIIAGYESKPPNENEVWMWNCGDDNLRPVRIDNLRVDDNLRPVRIEESSPASSSSDTNPVDPDPVDPDKETTRQIAVVKRKDARGYSLIALVGSSSDSICTTFSLKQDTPKRISEINGSRDHENDTSPIILYLWSSQHKNVTDGLSLTLYEKGVVSEEVEVTTSSSMKESILYSAEPKRLVEVEFKQLKVWHQGQLVVGFCFIDQSNLAHLCYTDLDTSRVKYVYNFTIEGRKKDHFLESELRSLKYKALHSYCRSNDMHKISKALDRLASKLDVYYHKGAVSDPDFQKLTEVPLVDTLGLLELSKKYPIVFR